MPCTQNLVELGGIACALTAAGKVTGKVKSFWYEPRLNYGRPFGLGGEDQCHTESISNFHCPLACFRRTKRYEWVLLFPVVHKLSFPVIHMQEY